MMEEKLRNKKLLKENFSWVFIVNLAIGLINFFTSIFFARQLGPSIMGDYATIIVAFELTFSFLSFGFNQYVISKKYAGDSYNVALTALVFQCAILLVLFCVFFFIFSFIEPLRTSELIIPIFIIMFSKIFSLFNLMFYSKLEAEFNYKKISISRFTATISGLTVAYLWFFIFADIYALILREFATSIIFLIISFVNVKPELKLSFNKVSLKELWKFSSSMWVLNFLDQVIHRLDFAIFGFLAGKEALGIYFTIRSIVEGFLGFILNPVQTVLLSYYTRLEKSAGYFSYLIKKILAIYLPVSIVLIIIIWFFKVSAIHLLLGDQYLIGEALLSGLAIYFFSIIWFENIKVFTISERIHHRMILPRISQLIGYLIFIYPLISYFGFFGAGFATGIGALILAISSTTNGIKYFSYIK